MPFSVRSPVGSPLASTSFAGLMAAADKAKSDKITGGTWTPTAAIVSNLDSVTPSQGVWMRVGDMVHCSVRVAMDPTTTSLVQFGLSLPVASNFTTNAQCTGAGGASGTFITSDSTNDRCDVQYFPATTTPTAGVFLFSYQVL